MEAIEFETRIDKNGQICVPEEFQHAYGKLVRLVVLMPEQGEPTRKKRQPGSAKGILKVLSEDNDTWMISGSICHEHLAEHTVALVFGSGGYPILFLSRKKWPPKKHCKFNRIKTSDFLDITPH